MTQIWYKKASVQAAIVGGIFLLIGISVPYYLRIPNLENQIAQLKNENLYKDIEIQKLQTQLVPFKTFALEHYQGSESEALAKLVNKITNVESTIKCFLYRFGNALLICPRIMLQSVSMTVLRLTQGHFDRGVSKWYKIQTRFKLFSAQKKKA